MNDLLVVNNDALYDVIPGDHWRAGYRINPEQLIYSPHSKIFTSERDCPRALAATSYCAPMVSRQQTKALAEQWAEELRQTKLQACRLRLADLRDDGVAVRIAGMELSAVEEVNSWVSQIENWNKTVIAAIAEIDEADFSSLLRWIFLVSPAVTCPLIFLMSTCACMLCMIAGWIT